MGEKTDASSKLKLPNRQGVSQFLPILDWLPRYQREYLPQDLMAGIFLAVLLIPQAMAYALLADLPPQIGLYAGIAPALIYAMFGNSRYLSIGPVALISLLVGETIAQVAGQGFEATAVALALAAIIGLILLLMGLLRLGFLVNFISDPVLTGFTSAAALLIATSQIRNLFGLDIQRGPFYDTWLQVINRVGETNSMALVIGLTVLLVLLLGNGPLKIWLKKQGISEKARTVLIKVLPLLLIALSTGLVWLFGLRQTVDVVGRLEAGLPPLKLPLFNTELWLALLPNALAISAIAYVTAMAVAKSLAGRRRQHIDPDQEAIALGMANLVASFSGGYPVGGSISRSAVNFDTGANTPISTATSAILVLLASLLIGPLFQFLPKAALAALIIAAVFGLFKWRAMYRVWRYSRADGVSLFITFFGVLLLGVDGGIAVGAISGLALYLWRTSRPRIVIEGRLNGDTEAFRSAARDDVEPETSPVLVLRIDESLYFANISYCENEALKAVAQEQQVRHLLLDLKSVNEIDASGLEMLNRLVTNLNRAGVSVSIAETKLPVLNTLERAGFLENVGKESVFETIGEALATLEEKTEQPSPSLALS